MLPDDPLLTWLKMIVYALFAAVGGFLGHLMRTIDARKKIKWGHSALQGIAAGFVGLLVFFACRALNLSEQWTGVIVGLAGWLGANASIRMLEKVVFKKLGIEDDQPIRERADDIPPRSPD
jgi:hypothetical protein